MGKMIFSQAKTKISKTSRGEKKPLNSLIKVLRPKVYIIDSSSFKTLGKAIVSSPSSPSLSSPSLSLPRISDPPEPVIELEDDPGNPESSMESSFDASVESFRDYEDLQAFLELDHVDEQCFGYSLNNVYSETHQEVSIDDYELSGLTSHEG
ncbi:hypothetical protein V6N12_023017 [Hibiscus sabdariffa]|uniref:Uncharacterized protein n=1 Tax=Hibiscus sabdariffa TaxID=183260 RepID=A0ABR2FWF1_9ROSI